MALVYKDRVLESSTTTGAGTYTLAGAITGHQAFSAVGNANTCYYSSFEVDGDGVPSGGWEVGLGTYTLSGTTLARTSILASSNSNNAVNWSAGTRQIALVHPASVFVGGSTTQLQYNNAGVLAGISGITFASSILETTVEFRPHRGNDQGVVIGNAAAGGGTTDDSINVGYAAGAGLARSSGGSQAIFIGRHAGYDATGATNAVCIGHAPAQYAPSVTSSVLIGAYVGRNLSALAATGFLAVGIGESVFADALAFQTASVVGVGACVGNGSTSDFTGAAVVGYQALETAVNAQYTCAMGRYAGRNSANNWYSVLIGYMAGYTVNRHYTLIIDSNDTYNQSGSTALIYGEFDNRVLKFNGTCYVGLAASSIGFYGVTPVARQVLATGAGRTVDEVITFLQTIGLCKQS